MFLIRFLSVFVFYFLLECLFDDTIHELFELIEIIICKINEIVDDFHDEIVIIFIRPQTKLILIIIKVVVLNRVHIVNRVIFYKLLQLIGYYDFFAQGIAQFYLLEILFNLFIYNLEEFATVFRINQNRFYLFILEHLEDILHNVLAHKYF